MNEFFERDPVMSNNVAVLGASDKEDRYSNMAVKLLIERGYEVFPINPAYEEIDGVRCYKAILDIEQPVDTLTVYMSPARLRILIPDIIAKKPRRVIFNPGSEDGQVEELLTDHGIETIKACTLVLLKSGRF
jgi:uncharacterized protein